MTRGSLAEPERKSAARDQGQGGAHPVPRRQDGFLEGFVQIQIQIQNQIQILILI